jgi:3-methyladenine DNA glycosylase AlkD
MATGRPAEAGVNEVVDTIVAGLRGGAQPERAAGEKAYLKSELEHWGVGVPGTRAVVKAALPPRSNPGHDLVVGVARALWAEPVHERRLAGALVLAANTSALGAGDLRLVEQMVREAKTWALVDVLAPDVVGPILVAAPDEAGAVVDRWNVDEDVWVRRASILALLRPLRAGGGDWDRFCRYADARWEDREFWVRKALGWVLRDTGRKRPKLVFDWLLPRAATASGVTVREAVRTFDDAQRAAIAMARNR